MEKAQITADGLHIGRCGFGPSNSHLRVNEPLETSIHFCLFDELAVVCLGDSFIYGVPETGVLFQKLQGGVSNQHVRLCTD